MDDKIIIAVIGSSVLSALLTALFGKMVSDKAIKIDNITKERKEWRDKLRKLSNATTVAFQEKNTNKLQLIEADLTVRLNPSDENDIDIINSIKKLSEQSSTDDDLSKFNFLMSGLLKHDWERVKIESGSQTSPQTLALATVCSYILILSINLKAQIVDNVNLIMASVILLLFFLVPLMFIYIWNLLFIKRKNQKISKSKFGHFMLNKAYRLSSDECTDTIKSCANAAIQPTQKAARLNSSVRHRKRHRVRRQHRSH